MQRCLMKRKVLKKLFYLVIFADFVAKSNIKNLITVLKPKKYFFKD